MNETSTGRTGQGASWVQEMHAHRERTGEYRARDVQRVLGDPRTAVIVTATGSFVASSHAINTAAVNDKT